MQIIAVAVNTSSWLAERGKKQGRQEFCGTCLFTLSFPTHLMPMVNAMTGCEGLVGYGLGTHNCGCIVSHCFVLVPLKIPNTVRQQVIYCFNFLLFP